MNRKRVINHVGFNQDHGCFTCSMDSGLRIFNLEPLKQKLHLNEALVGSVARCQMLYRTNLIAFIGGGDQPKFAENTVLIWDDSVKKLVLEYTFSEPVLNVRLLKDKLIVVLRNYIHAFSFPQPSVKLFSIETKNNIKGICEVSPGTASDKQLMVFPSGFKIGHIQIVDLHVTESTISSSPVIIDAHKTEIACIALNQSGSMVATASQRGTLIRVFDTKRNVKIVELRRGTDDATIYCINFRADSEWLCCSSDKGTVHIFALKDLHLNRRSALPTFGLVENTLRAAAKFSVSSECFCICAFGENSSVYAIYGDGTFQKYSYNTNGTCTQKLNESILDVCDDSD
ncbi:hypothetical protein CHUAL_013727 [Chamberlinius hualienensis]